MIQVSVEEAVIQISEASRQMRGRAVLAGLSGIDASGKGYLAAHMERMLIGQDHRVAAINIDGWLEHPARRFNPANPAEHFYARGLRMNDMFARLLHQLRDRRSISLATTQFDSSNSGIRHRHTYDYHDVDVVLVEGIFIFKRTYRDLFDLRFWVDCTFETAMERALSRNQESLSPSEILRDYETIYHPAQRIHFERDQPRESAHGVIINDHRLLSDACRITAEAGAR